MPTTATGLRYPSGNDAPTAATDIAKLASDVDLIKPRGELGYSARYTQAGPVSTSWVTVSGMSVTFTIATARKILATLDLQVTSNVAGTVVGAAIYNVTTTQRKAKTVSVTTANSGESLTIVTRTILAAGTYNFVAQQGHFGGAGGAYFTADPQELIIEDLGPG